MKNVMAIVALMVTVLGSYWAAFGQKDKLPDSKREKIEWTWTDHSDTIDPKLPNVLVLGDSITRAYFPEVAKKFAGVANVYLFATSCSAGDPRLAGQLKAYFAYAPKFKVIHFNNGMHGWDFSDEEFSAALPEMVRVIKRQHPESKLVWATITPVRVDQKPGATNARIDVRNADALKLMKAEGIVVDDQHGLMMAHQDLHLDDVHYNDAGAAMEGDQASDVIKASSKW
jgi:hypothetical protein